MISNLTQTGQTFADLLYITIACMCRPEGARVKRLAFLR